LLSFEQLRDRAEIPLPELLDAAQGQVKSFDGPVHAVIGFWDFPVSTMLPILCRRLGLRWTSLESVVKCEHKYWCRLEQRQVIDEYPRFGLVDLDRAAELPAGLRYPVWLKPVRSFCPRSRSGLRTSGSCPPRPRRSARASAGSAPRSSSCSTSSTCHRR
jgi:hypothetical protein